MNSCRYCKFLRTNREECFCYSLNENYLQEGQDLFLVPQQINFSCEYCEPCCGFQDFFYFDSEGNPHIKETNYVWDVVWSENDFRNNKQNY